MSSRRLPPADCRLRTAACRVAASSASMMASISRSRSRGPQHQASTATPSSSDGRPNSTPRNSHASSAISNSGGSRAKATPAGPCQALPPRASSQPSQRRKPSKRRSEAAAAGATWPRASATSTAARVVNMAGLPTKQNARRRYLTCRSGALSGEPDCNPCRVQVAAMQSPQPGRLSPSAAGTSARSGRAKSRSAATGGCPGHRPPHRAPVPRRPRRH